MNSEYNPQEKENPLDEIELNAADSLEDFIKELEAKERDLHLSFSESIVEIEELDIEESDERELEKLIENYQNKPVDATSFTNSGNNYFPNHQAVSGHDKELLQLRSEVSKLTLERTEMSESLRRRQLEFENFRKRIERERSDIFRSLLCNMAMKMLPVVDNLVRALDLTSDYTVEKTNDFQQFVDGIRLVNHQLNEVLEEMGIQPIISVGQPFNPHFHEAVAVEQSEEFEPNTVIEEVMRGYSIDDKVIRHSMVKVSTSANPVNKAEEDFLDMDEIILDMDSE
jgi:molecular chaperone GrpE